MDQRTHVWIAIRTVALLEDAGACADLVKLLKPVVKSADIGAWIPDLASAKLGGADTDNHILKMKPYIGSQKYRFTVPKNKLLKKLGSDRTLADFLAKDKTLDGQWWGAPYKADPQPGQHLADRAAALTTTIIDLLLMGDRNVSMRTPGYSTLSRLLDPNCLSTAEKAALYFFMQSHFVADASMPCHCDARKLSSYNAGLHKELEKNWAKKVGTYFSKKKLQATSDSPYKILNAARAVDTKFGISFKTTVPSLKERDVWLEMINICRGSFAVSCIIAPPSIYGYKSAKKAPFKNCFSDTAGSALLADIDKVAMHDAVLNSAIVWKYIWDKFH